MPVVYFLCTLGPFPDVSYTNIPSLYLSKKKKKKKREKNLLLKGTSTRW